jgi:hypothetical protein
MNLDMEGGRGTVNVILPVYSEVIDILIMIKFLAFFSKVSIP